MTNLAPETIAVLYWASQTKWKNTPTRFADAISRWKDVGMPNLPEAPLCPHCGHEKELRQ
jgi:hypothetical protein